MHSVDYDEDLNENPFYKNIVNTQKDLIKATSESSWIICVPRKDTVSFPITEEDVFEHFLVPNGKSFLSLNKTSVKVENNTIITQNGFSNNTRILFSETFYENGFKYKVHCIEYPLSGQISIHASEIKSLNNLRDCIDFLWIETYGRDILYRISKECTDFTKRNVNISSLEALKQACRSLYLKCLSLTLNSSCLLAEKTRTDAQVLANLKLSVETIIQHNLNNWTLNALNGLMQHKNANFNKLTRNLQELQMKDFNISQYTNCIPNAKSELGKICNLVTTLGKLKCLKNAFNILSQHNLNRNLTTEVLIQLFAFFMVKLNVNNWISQLTYLKSFVFSSDERGDHNFLITTLEASIEYIKSGALFEVLNSAQSLQVELFENIRKCDLNALEENFRGNMQMQPRQNTLCHPLCSCDNCEEFLKQMKKQKRYSLDFHDFKGRTSMHVACIYGFPQVVEFLIEKGADLNRKDYSGSAPIHYASIRGHQNALLLLLHSAVDLNAQNGDGNTALHLAAHAGHENCIKALLYYSEYVSDPETSIKINSVNFQKETALHVAAKWGYLSIVAILMQYGIDCSVRNNKEKTAADLAQNFYVKQFILQQKQPLETFARNEHLKLDFLGSQMNHIEEHHFGTRPLNLEQFKKTDLLLKSIENNDLPLSCFYLGIPLSVPSNKEPEAMCHPLCSCSACSSIDREENSLRNVGLKLHLNICNSEGFTPLHVAAQLGRNEILRILLDSGADCNLRTYKCLYSPLHLASINQRIVALKELLSCGTCNIDEQDRFGNTALHYACFKSDLRIIEVLLAAGADTGIKNAKGKTVLKEAQERSLFSVVKAIRSKNALNVGFLEEADSLL